MDLGAFSISLAVDDLDRSRDFYEKLGFDVAGGDADEGWLILASGTTIIGLFEGMFERNILTFNPGLDNHMAQLDDFTDVRDIQAELESRGLEILQPAAPDEDGPASITLVDPDGNPILIDQFFDRP